MTRYYDSTHKYRPTEDTPIPIGDEWTRDPNPSYICNFCNRTLTKLIDSSGQNTSYYCSACSIEVDPSLTEVRSQARLTTPDGPPDTPYVSTNFPEPTVGRKKKELTGSFKVLRDKGMRFTSVTESNIKR